MNKKKNIYMVFISTLIYNGTYLICSDNNYVQRLLDLSMYTHAPLILFHYFEPC